jgi:hypothetical protein
MSPRSRRSCNLRGTNAVTGEFLGYVRTDQNQFGVYGGLQDSPVGALKVALTYSGLMHTALSLKTTNGPSADYPYFGGGNKISLPCARPQIHFNF